MEQVGLWDREPPAALERALGTALCRDLLFVDPLEVETLDVLLVPPEGILTDVKPPVSRTTLWPSDVVAGLSRLQSRCVVSYGTQAKDSLTLSSFEPGALVLCVQREFPTLGGGSVERGDVHISVAPGLDPQYVLFSAGSLLLLGAQTHELEQKLHLLFPL